MTRIPCLPFFGVLIRHSTAPWTAATATPTSHPNASVSSTCSRFMRRCGRRWCPAFRRKRGIERRFLSTFGCHWDCEPISMTFLLIHEAQQGCRDATYEPSRFPVAVPYPSPHRATPAYVVVTSSDLDTSRNKASVSGLSWISRMTFSTIGMRQEEIILTAKQTIDFHWTTQP